MRKGKVEVTITLGKNTCYFLKTGKCSLNVLTDVGVSAAKPAPGDLLYCPRLLQAMLTKEKKKAVPVVPCACGHGQVVSGHQRVCIASQKGLPVFLRAARDTVEETCAVCGGQMTLEHTIGGQRIVTVQAVVEE